MARWNDCCLIRFGSIFIALSVVLAAVVAASETMTGIVVGEFCNNTDANAVAYARWGMGEGSIAYEATNYYITGTGGNPFSGQNSPLDKASKSVLSAKASL